MAKSTRPKSATSYKETAFGILPRSKVIILEGKGIKELQEYIIKLSGQKTEITPQLILDIHKRGFSSIFPEWAGKFRTIEVTIGEYEPPYHGKVPELIENLCADLAERVKHLSSQKKKGSYLAELVSILAWFQHRFVWIHPFQDYNGRMARLLTNFLLLNLGFPILTIKAETGKDRDKYIEAMKAADGYDYSRLENLIAEALEESLKKFA